MTKPPELVMANVVAATYHRQHGQAVRGCGVKGQLVMLALSGVAHTGGHRIPHTYPLSMAAGRAIVTRTLVRNARGPFDNDGFTAAGSFEIRGCWRESPRAVGCWVVETDDTGGVYGTFRGWYAARLGERWALVG